MLLKYFAQVKFKIMKTCARAVYFKFSLHNSWDCQNRESSKFRLCLNMRKQRFSFKSKRNLD